MADQPQPPKRKPVVFCNKQSKKAFQKSPQIIPFSMQLEDMIAYGVPPTMLSAPLRWQTIELKVQGSPAYRCVYKVLDDVVVVLHTFTKTTEGQDKKNMKTVETRVKALDPDQFC